MATNLKPARFYGILDTGYVTLERAREKCAALLAGGADIVQLRAKRETPQERRRWLETILPLFQETTVPLVVNDDLELALAYPGLGLHVGQDDLPPRIARAKLGPDRVLGLSTHSPEQAAAALAHGPDVLTYFAVGPVFATQTKPTYTPVGLELVRHVSALNPSLPFFCIGGINRRNAAEVKAAGATRIVVVSDVLLAEDTAAAVRELRAQFS